MTGFQAGQRYWETYSTARNVLPPRARLDSDAPELNLDGEWRFRYGERADGGDPGAEAPIRVPGHWQLQGYGIPQYTNVAYPIPLDPPYVPDRNPTGHYARTFRLPDGWAGRLATGDRAYLRFDGVDSCGLVTIDGRDIGVTAGSRLVQEFDVTAHLTGPPARHLLEVRVHQWSANTYLEDQDMWWLSGIFRSVALLLRPAGGIDDLAVHADYDPVAGAGTLRVDGPAGARVAIAELGIDTTTGTPVEVPVVRPWSAELPHRYTMTVSTPVETVTVRVGFRRVEVRDGLLLINGVRIVFNGVNRHEFDERTGRAVTDELARSDVLAMKRHHINAVRTSHYPPRPGFVDLCDELGLYVVAEGDFETHGFVAGGTRAAELNPTIRPEWTEALLDRTERLVRRDRNHPSVVLWSIGNEAGTGPNAAAMAARIRELDASRPVLYEQDYAGAFVDVYTMMYPSHDLLDQVGRRAEPVRADPDGRAGDERQLRRRRGLPFLMVEYAHAMGVGPGGLAEYQALTRRYERLQGGFIWEWIDHGLRHETADGRVVHRYGGDHGEPLHDGNFVCDGLLFPDRTPSPALLDVKQVYAPVRMSIVDTALTVHNDHAFRDTGAYRFLVSTSIAAGSEVDAAAAAAGAVADRGGWVDLDVPVTPPGGHVRVNLPGIPATVRVVTVRAVLRDAEPWAPAGHPVSHAQVVFPAPPLPRRPRVPAIVHDGRRIRLGGAEIDASTGTAILSPDRQPLSLGDLTTDLWRAPIDNERAFAAGGLEPRWRALGLHRTNERLVSMEVTGDTVTVIRRLGAAAVPYGVTTTTRWTSDGDILWMEHRMVPDHPPDVPLPRLGVTFSVDGAFDRFWYRGRGPGESYPDTGLATLFGEYSGRVAELQTPYVYPQENGNRSGVEEAILAAGPAALPGAVGVAALPGMVGFASPPGAVGFASLPGGHGAPGRRLRLLTPDGAGLAVRPWNSATLTATTHHGLLRPDGRTWVTLSARLHGVGSAACGPGVLPAYRLGPEEAVLRVGFAVEPG